MYTIKNHIGYIRVTEQYLKSLVWLTVTESFGVAGMEYSNPKERFLDVFMRGKYRNKGITISLKKDRIKINLHIKIAMGANISAIAENISHKLSFVLEQATGIKNKEINIFVENIEV